jgi:histidinol phosphatase-like enzyme (inositol monophosphatase family)
VYSSGFTGISRCVDPAPFRAFLEELATLSGDFIRPRYRNPDIPVELKRDRTVVTEADRGAEELMRKAIAKRFPDHGILGEEFGPDRTDSEWVWVLDPIDGTRAFVAGVPLWGTLIALLHRGQPVLGCINQPVLNQLVVGDGETTTLNGKPVRLRPCTKIEDALLLTTSTHSPSRHQNGTAFEALSRRVQDLNTWGDCYSYLLLACGNADIACDPVMNPWDLLALIPVVRGAGGVITDWQGKDPVKGSSIVAAGPAIHSQVIAALNSAPAR